MCIRCFADPILPKTTQLEEEAFFIEDNCLTIMQQAIPVRSEANTDFEIAIGLRDALRAREDCLLSRRCRGIAAGNSSNINWPIPTLLSMNYARLDSVNSVRL